jgi:hypothetical protein
MVDELGCYYKPLLIPAKVVNGSFHGIKIIWWGIYEHGWQVNHKRVERIWRREGLKVPKKQPRRGRLWLNDGSCIRLRPEYKDHVWSYDFMIDRTADGRSNISAHHLARQE